MLHLPTWPHSQGRIHPPSGSCWQPGRTWPQSRTPQTVGSWGLCCHQAECRWWRPCCRCRTSSHCCHRWSSEQLSHGQGEIPGQEYSHRWAGNVSMVRGCDPVWVLVNCLLVAERHSNQVYLRDRSHLWICMYRPQEIHVADHTCSLTQLLQTVTSSQQSSHPYLIARLVAEMTHKYQSGIRNI